MGAAAAGGAQAGIGALQMIEAKNQADMQRSRAEFAARQAEFNAALIETQQEQLKSQMLKDIDARQRQVKQMLGSQKAAMAGQGIDVEGELGQLFKEQEQQFALEDVQAIRNNAWRESMGLEVQKSDLRTQAAFTRLGGKEARRQTLVTGGMQAASSIIGGARTYQQG